MKSKQILNGKYTVTEDGNIISSKLGRPLQPYITYHGYKQIALCPIDQKRVTRLVHRIVAETFVSNPYNKPFVNHKDGNKLNNRADNLEWATNQENIIHSFTVLGRQGTNKGRFNGEHNRANKLTISNLKGEIISIFDCLKTSKIHHREIKRYANTGKPYNGQLITTDKPITKYCFQISPTKTIKHN